MQRGRFLNLTALAGALTLAAGVAHASPPPPAALPAGFTDMDIGNVHNSPGSTSVTGSGATAVWTINGTGDDIWNAADSFHFTYASLPGDGGITARILTQTGGDPSWAKTGTMLRETTDPGSLDAYMPYTSGNKFEGSWRVTAKKTPQDNGTGNTGRTLAGGPIWIRTQRHGKSYQHLLSDNGKDWSLIGSQDLNIDPSKAVLAGLCATSHDAKKTVTATFDNVSVSADVIQPDILAGPGQVVAVGGNGAVLLTYSTTTGANYNIYRQQAGSKTPAALVNPTPTANGWFIDTGVMNGTAYDYTVTSITKSVADPTKLLEGPPSAQALAQPMAPVGGFNVQYGGAITPAAVAVDNKGVLTLTASGTPMWDTSANGTFLAAPVSGDYSVNVKVLSPPTRQAGLKLNSDTKVGPMIRASAGVVPGDDYAWAFTADRTDGNGVIIEGRPSGVKSAPYSETATKEKDVKYPLWLTLSKTGAVISAYQSNDGNTFTQVGTSHDYGLLPALTYAGIGATSGDTAKTMTVTLDAASIQIGPPHQ